MITIIRTTTDITTIYITMDMDMDTIIMAIAIAIMGTIIMAIAIAIMGTIIMAIAIAIMGTIITTMITIMFTIRSAFDRNYLLMARSLAVARRLLNGNVDLDIDAMIHSYSDPPFTILTHPHSAGFAFHVALTGLGYVLLFDAFGVLNIFISNVISTDTNMKQSTVKHPFGIERFEVLFGLFNAIYLLFIGMNMLKESLEHLMLEDDHHGGGMDHGSVVRIPIFWALVGLGSTIISAGYQNHKQFCSLLNPGTKSMTLPVFRNQFTMTVLGSVAGVLLVAAFPRIESLDKVVAIIQSIVFFYLGGPLTKVLGMILLQTTPPRALESVEEAIRQLSFTNPAIVRIERSHLWTNTYGQMIGTLIVGVAKGSDEQAILASIHGRLMSEGISELTVQLVQH
ncbi:Endoplasmic reticulum zinc transporter [Podila epigama]|nr:Endoplasmic reticulum zinc transporter [Podila epigama]